MSERPLAQHEIDALIDAVRAGRIATRRDSLARVAGAEPLDLRNPEWSRDRVVRRRLPVLDMVFERLGPLIQVTLTKSLRFPARTEAPQLELGVFRDFVHALPDAPCMLEVIRLDPLRGYALMVFEPALMYALIDASMGGLGVAEPPADRDVSDIEVSLLQRVTAGLLRDLENAWRPWFPLRVEHVRSDRGSLGGVTLSPAEVCHVATLHVTGDVLPKTPLRFVLPYPMLEPLLDATSSRVSEETDPIWREHLDRSVREAEAELSAVLGAARLSAAEVRALAEGSVIELDRRVQEPIELQVEGLPVFSAQIGQDRGQYAVQILHRHEGRHEHIDRTAGEILVRKGLITHEQLAVARVDEKLNRKNLLDSISSRGWVERRVLESALGS